MLLLDTNQIGPKDLRHSLVHRIYQEIARHIGTELVISRIAWLEHLHEFEEGIRESIIEERASTAIELPEQDIVNYAKIIRRSYEEEVSAVVAITDEYSQEEYAEAFRREIWRELPAKQHGRRALGARDTLVWLDAKKSVKQGQNVVILSNDKSAFGSDSILHAQLINELETSESMCLHYFNDLGKYLEVLGVVENQPIAMETADEVSQRALYDAVNSPGTFVMLVSMINRPLSTGYARNAAPPSINRAEILGSPYAFRLEDHEYIGMKISGNARKEFSFTELSGGTSEPWSFEVDGAVTVLAKRVAGMETYESEIINWSMSEEKSVVINPSGERTSFAEARNRSLET
ncbi:MAG: hypothetical protein ACYC19_08095 [Acidimicrobiales bacterium]